MCVGRLRNTLVTCVTHPMNPGEGASWLGHLPSICDAGYGHFTYLVRHNVDGGVRQCQSLYLGASLTRYSLRQAFISGFDDLRSRFHSENRPEIGHILHNDGVCNFQTLLI